MIDSLEKLAENKILLPGDAVLKKWKDDKLKIVFTNGCFDILHIGHLSYLLKAASLGDKLIIGLNSDASVKRLKGSNRPINLEESRALMLASLYFVDAVIIFDTDTPLQLITQLLPNVLVKGGDYIKENIVGAKEVEENDGEVVVVKFLDEHSSTSIINKINSGL